MTSLQFTNPDQLVQGASTLSGITGNVAGSELLAGTLDSAGREAAVEMLAVIQFPE